MDKVSLDKEFGKVNVTNNGIEFCGNNDSVSIIPYASIAGIDVQDNKVKVTTVTGEVRYISTQTSCSDSLTILRESVLYKISILQDKLAKDFLDKVKDRLNAKHKDDIEDKVIFAMRSLGYCAELVEF